MNSIVSSLRTHAAAAASETAPILEESSNLLTQKRETEGKEALLRAFTEHFVVSEEDVVHLTSSAEPVDDRYFKILDRVKKIHGDCEVLLASENQRAGYVVGRALLGIAGAGANLLNSLEIMDRMTSHLHGAFQKLYRWIQKELKFISLENPQINAGIRRALRVLAERPTLFQYICLPPPGARFL